MRTLLRVSIPLSPRPHWPDSPAIPAGRENFDKRIALGMAAIAAGAVILSWPD